MEQKTGLAAVSSIIAAIGSFILVFSGHPIWGLIVAMAAVILGFLGLLMAASPRVSGGILSIIAILIGVGGFGVAILGIVGVILF